MYIWVDQDSGTFGVGDTILDIDLTDAEVDEFGEFSDSQRVYIARRMAKHGDTYGEACELWDSP